MTKGTDAVQDIRKALGLLPDVKLFRNNVGSAWMGEAIPAGPGSVLIKHARRVHFGLFPGSSDLIGWRSVPIESPYNVSKIAQFLSVEVKSGTGRLSKDQRQWLTNVRAAGGLAIEAHDPDDVLAALNRLDL